MIKAMKVLIEGRYQKTLTKIPKQIVGGTNWQ